MMPYPLMLILLALSSAAWCRPPFIEDMTTDEVQSYLAKGNTTAGGTTVLIYAGSTEQNGPHMVLGKHNVIAREVAAAIARRLGHTLIYPILPFAPTGDPVAGTGHMRHAGSISLSPDTYARIATETAQSAKASGFRTILLLGDHGDGQDRLARVAAELDAAWASGGTRVLHVSDVYAKTIERETQYLRARGLDPGGHAGLADTAVLLYLDRKGTLVRRAALGRASSAPGVEGDPRGATRALGQALFNLKVETALEQIRRFQATRERL